MSIKFHCDHCGKKIDAPDGTGGKWGKCPACHNKVYVPMDDPEELTLAPIDETEEERQKRLMAETFQLTQNILQEKDIPEPSAVTGLSPDIGEDQLTAIIVRYLQQMANGDLDDAQRTAEAIATHRRQAKVILTELAKGDPVHDELQGIPPQVLSGLIRNLKTRIS